MNRWKRLLNVVLSPLLRDVESSMALAFGVGVDGAESNLNGSSGLRADGVSGSMAGEIPDLRFLPSHFLSGLRIGQPSRGGSKKA